MTPKKIRQPTREELTVEWDDGHHGRHTVETLRNQCPCASCRADREAGSSLLPVLTPGKYEIQNVDPVGSYALQISWRDGHRTGIYTFEYLRYLCECAECTKTAHDQRTR